MTDEERKIALYCLKVGSDYHSEVCQECIKFHNCDQNDVTETIIKELEQEPCEDCISRQAVLEGIAELVADGYADSEADISHISSLVTHLPSVTPTRKKGKWEHGYSFPDGNYAKCTACGEIIKCTYPMHFCPNCGSDNRGEEQ